MELKREALCGEFGRRLAAAAVAAGDIYPDEEAYMARHLGARGCRAIRAVIDREYAEECAEEREEMFAEVLAMVLDGRRPDLYAGMAEAFGRGIQVAEKKAGSGI